MIKGYMIEAGEKIKKGDMYYDSLFNKVVEVNPLQVDRILGKEYTAILFRPIKQKDKK